MENIGIFYDHLEYFTAFTYKFLPFCIVCDRLVYFFQCGMLGARKLWQPWPRPRGLIFKKIGTGIISVRFATRVARVFLVIITQTGKNVPNEHKMYQMNTKCTKWS
jgi:hypothetical protein